MRKIANKKPIKRINETELYRLNLENSPKNMVKKPKKSKI